MECELDVLERIEKHLRPRAPIDNTIAISAYQPYILDYKNRNKVFIFCSIPMDLSLEDMGNIPIPANTWINISFREGMKLTALGVTTPINATVRATDNDISNADPFLTSGNIPALIAAGQGFSLSLGNFTSGSSTNQYAVAVFNPSSNKNVFIYSVQIANGSGGLTGLLQLVTSDPGFTQTNPINSRGGGPASSVQATSELSTGGATPLAGTFRQITTIASSSQEMLSNGDGILLPRGSSNGLVAYIQTFGAGINSATVKWVEY